MPKKPYTDEHAKSGTDAKLPPLETWPNQYDTDYEIATVIPEFTSICPRTSLPDFGTITVSYVPDKLCVELKSLKMYMLGYRTLGIFYENAVNKILKDLVATCRPKWMRVVGDFNVRGGMKSTITVEYPRRPRGGQ